MTIVVVVTHYDHIVVVVVGRIGVIHYETGQILMRRGGR